jgi:hypothetical protein
MNTTGLVKCAGALIAVALCSACSGAPDDAAVAPSSAALNVRYVGKTLSVNGRLVTAARANLSTPPRFATLAPNAVDGRKREYVINYYGTYASIFDYPKSDAQIGKINDVGGQGCSDVLYGYGKHTFWIVAGADQITEYRVRKTKPIKTLSVTNGSPSSCAMDSSGDLAVGILYDYSGSGGGDIVIFKNATGTGTVYSTPLAREYFDGYDPNGNLFFDGLTGSDDFKLLELPKGSSKIQTITTSNKVQFPGSVQWDGTYLTVTDQNTSEMYRYTVSGTKATLEGTVSLAGASDCAQTWIAKGVVYCGDAGNEDGEVYNYPAGGASIAVFTGNFDLPLGVVAARE